MDKFFDRLAKSLASPTTRRGFFRKAAVASSAAAVGVLGARPALAFCGGPPVARCTVTNYYSKTFSSTCSNENWCVPNESCGPPFPTTSDTYTATFNYYLVKITANDPGALCWEQISLTHTANCNCA